MLMVEFCSRLLLDSFTNNLTNDTAPLRVDLSKKGLGGGRRPLKKTFSKTSALSVTQLTFSSS